MNYNKLYEQSLKAAKELERLGLKKEGYGIQIELSINSYRDLLKESIIGNEIQFEVDTPTERVNRGTIKGIPFVLTLDTDRVLITKEIKE